MINQQDKLEKDSMLAIVKLGFNVLWANGRYYVTYKFEHAQSGSMPIDFNYVEGIDVTSFLVSSYNFINNETQFAQSLNQYIEKDIILSIKFSKEMDWVYMSGK